MPETLASLGEAELLRRLSRFAPPGQLEDDAALLLCPAGAELVVNTDVFVEGVHFSDLAMNGHAVGWRVTAANGSDLAAMGCSSCLGLTVGLVAPGRTPWPWVEQVYEGLAEALEVFGGEILGGDCSGGVQRILAVTAMGVIHRGKPIRRYDARPGDWLICTGPHGLSRMGLALLQGELSGMAVPEPLQKLAIRCHQHPRPRWDASQRLMRARPPGCPWRVGGVDSSDGLLAALEALAASSSCRLIIQEQNLPIADSMAAFPQAKSWCVTGGEDFELILSLEPRWAQALIELTRVEAIEQPDGPSAYSHLGWVEALSAEESGEAPEAGKIEVVTAPGGQSLRKWVVQNSSQEGSGDRPFNHFQG